MSQFSTPTSGLVDLHSHLIPGVDDGTRSVEESLASLRELGRDGVTRLVTTPHLVIPRLPDAAAITAALDRQQAGYDAVRAAANSNGHLPEFALGQEVLLPDTDSARRALAEPRIGLDGTDFWLIEFGFDLPATHGEVIHVLQQAGRQVIVAHPERYLHASFDAGLETIRAWYTLGAWLQINSGSLAGHYERSSPLSESLAWTMLHEGLAHLIATDHHGARRPGVSPAEAAEELTSRGGALQADRLLRENPGRILLNQLPYPVTPLPETNRK